MCDAVIADNSSLDRVLAMPGLGYQPELSPFSKPASKIA